MVYLTRRENEVLDYVHIKTLEGLQQEEYETLGCDALNISLDMFIDRSNISRILNKLYREGLLSKIDGRPTLFLSKKAMNQLYPDIFVPESFNKIDDIEPFIKEQGAFRTKAIGVFSETIGSSDNESLSLLISDLKSALSYPPHGLPVEITGSSHEELKDIATQAFAYGISKNIFSSKNDYYYIDCLELDNDFDILSFIKEKCIYKKNLKMIVLHNYRSMPEKELMKLKGLLSNYSIFDLKTKKEYPLSFFFLLTSQYDNKNIEVNINKVIPVHLKLPIFEERTVKEKLLLVLSKFQEEATKINCTIRLNKNVVNCFTMANYTDCNSHYSLEIRTSIAKAMMRSRNKNVIEVELDDLSDELLLSITHVNSYISDLYQIYELYNSNTFEFNPKGDLKFSELVANRVIINDAHEQEIVELNNANRKQMVAYACTSLIRKYSKEKVDTIQSYPLQNLYDMLYDELCEDVIYDNLVLGLLSYIQENINKISSLNYINPYDDSLDMYEMSSTVNAIVNKIEISFNISYPIQERYFIDEYIRQSKFLSKQTYIGMIIISNFKSSANNFYRYLDVYQPNGSYYTLSINDFFANNKTDQLRKKSFKNIVESVDAGKGLIIVCEDTEIEKTVSSYIEDKNRFVTFSNVSLSKLDSILQLIQRPYSTLSDFESFIVGEGEFDYNEIDYLEIMKNEVLSNSLTFLNPEKIVGFAHQIFTEICDELKMSTSEILEVKFILHLAFLIERTLIGENMSYKDSKAFLERHRNYYYVVEKHISRVEEVFGIRIGQEELIYVSLIFIEEAENSF